MANAKNQNTLYRFVSLRNPELSKKENQDLRFVFHPLNDSLLSTSSTNFFKAIHDKVETMTKWQALQEFCVTFESGTSTSQAAFTSESQLKSLNEDFYLVADWLAVNKAKLDATAIYTKVNQVTNLSNDDALVVWDNLFYQTIAQKSFYIKENCIQMLVLFNLKEKIVGLTQANAIKIIKQLADARVVLPTSLFEENETIIEDTSAARLNLANQNAVITKEVLDAQDKIIANFLIEDYQKLIKDLEKVQKRYDKEKGIAYNKAYSDHQQKVSPLITAYQKEYNKLKRELCKIPRDANYDPNDFCNQPDLEYPVLPVFTFEYPSIVDSKILDKNLPEDSMLLLSNLMDVSELENVSEAIELAKEKIKEQQQEIVSKTVFSKKVMVIGDVVLPIKKVASRLNVISFRMCFKWTWSNRISPYMTFQVPNNEYTIQSVNYQTKNVDGTMNIGTTFNASTSGNTVSLINLGDYDIYVTGNGNNALLDYKIEITFSNGLVFVFEKPSVSFYSCFNDVLTEQSKPDTGTTEEISSFIPKGFGYRQLGIADYRKVVSHVCCYDAGEVAHIENIMAREFKEKTTEKVYSKEITDFSSSETERESVSDTTSTERFEMQTEIAKLIQEDKQFGAYANFTASWGAPGTSYQLDAGANYATNTSKEESNRQAVNQAKELTQRAMERIVTRVRTEKTVKVTESFTDKNSHIFDNRAGTEHVSGVYRFINAIYKNQIYNYGKRLMYEFMIPQPSTLHRLGMKVSNADLNAILLDRPIDPRIAYPTFESIDEGNYKLLASKYGAEVSLYPEQYKIIGKSFAFCGSSTNEVSSENFYLEIPSNYYTKHVKVKVYAHWDVDNSQYHSFGITVGNIKLFKEEHRSSFEIEFDSELDSTILIDKFSEKLPISYQSLNYLALNVSVTVKNELSSYGIENWKKETYQAILDGYNAQVEAYNQQEAAAKAKGVEMLDSNPLFYRQTEQLILKKNAISYLIDNSKDSKRKMGLPMYDENANFTNYQVILNQDMDNYTSFVKFMEQAFDWNIMSYNFYPFYWGNDKDWDDLYQYDSNDPLFRSFMQAGMARVVVTVKPGFEEAVMHYMKFGQIWNGGQMPVIGNPLYLSIVDELKEQEYEVEETWETVVPTNLVALQSSGVALDEHGLPCGDDCETDSKFMKSVAKLEATKPVSNPV